MEEIEKTGQEENKAQPVPEENVAAEAKPAPEEEAAAETGPVPETRMKQLLLEKKVPHPLCPLTNTWQQVFT
jgi:hypothetical protein